VCFRVLDVFAVDKRGLVVLFKGFVYAALIFSAAVSVTYVY
jgi:hypothetical protein